MGVGLNHDDTIVAIASPHGSARRGIVRASGPKALECVFAAFEPVDTHLCPTALKNPAVIEGTLVLDKARIPGRLSVWPTEKSYTGQPSIEFHTFGSIPVLELIVKALCNSGARPAEPGEFTMRAFLSGRLDLTQAEAVLAVIDAKDRRQLNVAIEQLAGGMGHRLSSVRSELLTVLAELEAGLDFVEEDIEFISNNALIDKLHKAKTSVENLLFQCRSRDSSNPGFRASLFGLPNAGKSTLFNCLLGKDVAIVADVEGTTTDRVMTELVVGSQRLELVDTAGLESPGDDKSISGMSQEQRRQEVAQCELAILCIEARTAVENPQFTTEQLCDFSGKEVIVVLTKTDRCRAEQIEMTRHSIQCLMPGRPLILTSAKSNEGIDDLRSVLERKAIDSQSSESGIVGSTMVRTEQSLLDANFAIGSALDAASVGIGEEIVASELRLALDALGTIVGTIYTDDILDVVFGKFCIGK